MALNNVGSLILNLIIFVTTLVNFSYALRTLEPVMLVLLYAITKVFTPPPEHGIFTRSQILKYIDNYGMLSGNNFESSEERGCNGFTSNYEGPSTGTDARDHGEHVGRNNDSCLPQKEKWPNKASFRDRISCYTWTWFTMTMATGGIANVLHSIPYRPDWLRITGVLFFLFNVGLFLVNCLLITLRFRWNPGSFTSAFKSPSESLFVPASVVSVGTILINMCQYGIFETGEWLQTAMQVCFWVYASISIVASAGIYLIIWSTQTFPIHTMTPIWIFPAYPLMLIAPLASNLIDAVPNAAAAARINSLTIALGAVCIQGTGFLVSLMIYSAYIYRLMTQKIPRETTRPGMFVSVGPSGFTTAGLVHLGNTVIPKIIPDGYMGHEDAAFFLKLLSDLVGLWLWGLCLWFFLVSVGAHWQVIFRNDPKHHIEFDMTWYSFVFPNTALVTATQAIGKSLGSGAIQMFGTVLAGILVIVWIFVFGMMIRAILLKRLLWPRNVSTTKSQNKHYRKSKPGLSRTHGVLQV